MEFEGEALENVGMGMNIPPLLGEVVDEAIVKTGTEGDAVGRDPAAAVVMGIAEGAAVGNAMSEDSVARVMQRLGRGTSSTVVTSAGLAPTVE